MCDKQKIIKGFLPSEFPQFRVYWIKLKYFSHFMVDDSEPDFRYEMDTSVTTMSAALRGAVLKREKAAAARLARAAGKVAAAALRAEEEKIRGERSAMIAEETVCIGFKVAAARRALGVGCDEPHPTSVCLLIESLTSEMRFRLAAKGFW